MTGSGMTGSGTESGTGGRGGRWSGLACDVHQVVDQPLAADCLACATLSAHHHRLVAATRVYNEIVSDREREKEREKGEKERERESKRESEREREKRAQERERERERDQERSGESKSSTKDRKFKSTSSFLFLTNTVQRTSHRCSVTERYAISAMAKMCGGTEP
jgi:hypothetical protein